jgi:hypothetical protein
MNQILQKFKTIHDSALRGACCAVWVFGLIIAFYQFLEVVMSEMGSAEANAAMIRLVICLGAVVSGAAIHAYLISICPEK